MKINFQSDNLIDYYELGKLVKSNLQVVWSKSGFQAGAWKPDFLPLTEILRKLVE